MYVISLVGEPRGNSVLAYNNLSGPGEFILNLRLCPACSCYLLETFAVSLAMVNMQLTKKIEQEI